MPAGAQRTPPSATQQHIKPSHFWSSSFAPPAHYWHHSQSHSLLEIESLSVSDPRAAGRASPPPPPAAVDAHPARTLERASKSSSLKRLCSSGVTRMGSYLETLHRAAKMVEIVEDADGEEPAAAATADRAAVAKAPRRRPGRTPLRAVLGSQPPQQPPAAARPDAGSVGASSDVSDEHSSGVSRSPVPSSHIYIDMPPRRFKPSAWNCTSGSDPEDEESCSTPQRRCDLAGGPPAPCACLSRLGDQADPWHHRAIEYVMVPKSQYLSLYRANRLLRDACCCQGLGQASKLCHNCRQPTVILRSPSPAVSAPASSDDRSDHSCTGSLQTRRPPTGASSAAGRAQTLLPRLNKRKPAGHKPPARRTHFSSQELLLDHGSPACPTRETARLSPTAAVRLAGNCHVTLERGSTAVTRAPMRLDYTDSWRSLSRNTSSSACSSGGSQ